MFTSDGKLMLLCDFTSTAYQKICKWVSVRTTIVKYNWQ